MWTLRYRMGGSRRRSSKRRRSSWMGSIV